MDRRSAADDLKAIKRTIYRAGEAMTRRSGWFLVLWGTIWLAGFTTAQFACAASQYVWIGLNSLGFVMSVVLASVLYGKRSENRVPGVNVRIWGAIGGVTVFAVLLIALLFGTPGPRELTIVIMLTAALCYFLVGIFTNPRLCIMGGLMAAALTVADLVFPGYFYLVVAISCGGLLILTGVTTLTRPVRRDV